MKVKGYHMPDNHCLTPQYALRRRKNGVSVLICPIHSIVWFKTTNVKPQGTTKSLGCTENKNAASCQISTDFYKSVGPPILSLKYQCRYVGMNRNRWPLFTYILYERVMSTKELFLFVDCHPNWAWCHEREWVRDWWVTRKPHLTAHDLTRKLK